MPKQVILDWDEYAELEYCKEICCKIAEASSVAMHLYLKDLITQENAKAYLMPILKVLSEE